MANTRIKDLSTTASSAANDDYLAIDGSTNGTRKILASNIGGGSVDWSDISNKPTFATVATTGDYDDLTGKPTIPTNTSDLNNDSGFITLADLPIYDGGVS